MFYVDGLTQISEIKIADIPDVDLSKVGVTKFGSFSVEVIDPVSDYLELLEVKINCLHCDNLLVTHHYDLSVVIFIILIYSFIIFPADSI